MFNPDTEVLFPTRVISHLRNMHGDEWRSLVDRILEGEATQSEYFAFVLTMVRLCGCTGCSADSFRAMRGCTQCARQTMRRYRGSDHEIVEQVRQSQLEVEAYMQKNGIA
ncbi:MAG: hypothetical protein GX491_18860 [Chloroflexi bacterium]|nr:hypothetical protein [Chloroflexota bacterium]